METGKNLMWFLLAALIILGFAAMTTPTSSMAAGPKYGGELRFAYGLEASSLDPHLGRSGGDAYYWRQMFDHIVGADASYVSRPDLSLASRWEMQGSKTIVFHLRTGVKFHDGTDFNAEAIKFNIERMLAPKSTATPKASFSVIENVEVVDPFTVKFHLKRPWGAGLGMLADRGGAVNSPKAIKKYGKEYGYKPVGTGPFKLVEYISGSHAKFVKNADYWGKDAAGNRLPYLDALTIKIIVDQTVTSAALKTGEIDMAFIPPKDVDKFQVDKKFNVQKFEGSGIAQMISFNITKPPMDNVNLRRALIHAVNPEVINRSAFFGKAIVAKAGMWPVGTWVYDDTVWRPHYDLERARELLKKGGKPKGFSMDVIAYKVPTMVQAAEVLKAQLAQVGINVDIKVYDVGTATDKFFHTNEAPIYSNGWSRYPEPDWIASLVYKSKGYYNAGNVPNPKMDELIKKGASSYDIKERKAIYRKVNEIVLGECWMVPLLYGVAYVGAPLKVQGTDSVFGWDAKLMFKQVWFK